MKKIFTLTIAIALLAAGCRSTVGFQVIEPAFITLPPQLKKVVILNRTAADRLKPFNQLEQMLSMEWAKEDGKASVRCIEGLGATLANSLKQYQVVVLKDTNLVGTGDKILPEPFKKSFIDSICKKYSADFVIALESFDTSILNKANGLPATLSAMTITSVISGPSYTLMSSITTGWRIYDPNAKNLYDQYQEKANYDFAAMRITDQEVILHLPHALQGIYQNGALCGENYGFRIVPHEVTRFRFMYRKGSSDLRLAHRYAAVGKWDEAYNIWQKNTNSGKRKVAYRSLYNMAVYNEKMGDINNACKIIEDAYIKYNRRQALDYKNNLEFIKLQNQKANEQLGN
jgi:hypothetical protein